MNELTVDILRALLVVGSPFAFGLLALAHNVHGKLDKVEDERSLNPRSTDYLVEALRGEFWFVLLSSAAALLASLVALVRTYRIETPAENPSLIMFVFFALHTSIAATYHYWYRDVKTISHRSLRKRIGDLRLVWSHFLAVFYWRYYGMKGRFWMTLRAIFRVLRPLYFAPVTLLATIMFVNLVLNVYPNPAPDTGIIKALVRLSEFYLFGPPLPINLGVLVSFLFIKLLYEIAGCDQGTRLLYSLRDEPIIYAHILLPAGIVFVEERDRDCPYSGMLVFPHTKLDAELPDHRHDVEALAIERLKVVLAPLDLEIVWHRYRLENTVKFYDNQRQEYWHWAHIVDVFVRQTTQSPTGYTIIPINEIIEHERIPSPFVEAAQNIKAPIPPYRLWAPASSPYLVLKYRSH